jgi:hypothetical protein
MIQNARRRVAITTAPRENVVGHALGVGEPEEERGARGPEDRPSIGSVVDPVRGDKSISRVAVDDFGVGVALGV